MANRRARGAIVALWAVILLVGAFSGVSASVAQGAWVTTDSGYTWEGHSCGWHPCEGNPQTFTVDLVQTDSGWAYHPQAQSDVPTENPVTGDNPVDINATLVTWQIILGFMSTVIIAGVNRAIPGVTPDDNTKRAIVAFVFCILVAMADVAIRGVFNAANLIATFVVIFGAAISFYTQWFKTSGIAGKIEGKPGA